jgi:hypothetical protein
MTTTLTAPAPTPTATGVAPVAGIPFARLLRVEWGKATDTRAARWLIAITAVATVAIMLAPVLAKHSVSQTWRNYVDFPAFVLATLLPVVAILTLTTEWTQRTVLTTFTQEPRRGRVVSAKVLVSVLLALAAAAFGGVVSGAAGWLVEAGGRDITGHFGWAQFVGFPLFLLLNILMGTAFGAALHNSAAAIVLFFVLPTACGFLGEAVHPVQTWFDTSTVFSWVLTGDWSGHAANVVVCTATWVALPLAAGLVRTLRREIK